MGSTGLGRFTDYSGRTKDATGAGGSSGEDACNKAFGARVEEVDRCDFVRQHGQPPSVGTEVQIGFDQRPTVVTTEGTLIGYLPTEYNYLRACIEAGYTYVGEVTQTRLRPVASVSVDIQPQQP